MWLWADTGLSVWNTCSDEHCHEDWHVMKSPCTATWYFYMV
jgi:hypothetical protein